MLNHEVKKTCKAESQNASLISYLKLPNQAILVLVGIWNQVN